LANASNTSNGTNERIDTILKEALENNRTKQPLKIHYEPKKNEKPRILPSKLFPKLPVTSQQIKRNFILPTTKIFSRPKPSPTKTEG